MTKICVIMIGLPACGKSTLHKEICALHTKEAQESLPVWTTHSSDQHIEEYAKVYGKTYNDVWTMYKDKAEEKFWTSLKQAVEFGDQVIFVDRTNLTKKSRRRIMDTVGPEYQYIALHVFCNNYQRKERNAARIGKEIPEDVVNSMRERIETETYGEGFEHIWCYDTTVPTEDGIKNTNPEGWDAKYLYQMLKTFVST